MSHGTVGPESGADTQTYSSLPNKVVDAPNGIDYAYRDVGESTVPLGPGPDRRARLDAASRDLRQRRRRRLHRSHSGHHRADGPRCGRHAWLGA